MADNKLAEARNYLDINGLNAIRHEAKTGDKAAKKEALQEAAQQFEAIFTRMLMQSMRKAQDVLESDSPFNSESTKFYRDMHDQQMSVELSSNGSLGLSELIVRQLGGDDNFSPSSILRNDGNLNTRELNNKHSFSTNQDHEIKARLNLLNQSNEQYSNRSASQSNVQANEQANVQSNVQTHVQTHVQNPNASNNRQVPIPFATSEVLSNKNSVIENQFNQPKDFVSALIKPAKLVESKLGVPFEVVIAQAALETGWGQKIIQTEQGQSSNNLFNIKADGRWQGDKTNKDTLEFEQGALVRKSASFRTYQSITDSVNDYIDFLSTGERYQPALENSGNVEHFLHGIQKAGYATDPNYATKIMATLSKVSSLLNHK